MAHVSNGRVSSMPGTYYQLIQGHTCDTVGHEKIPSYRMMQGETDSFGCEFIDMCSDCYHKRLDKKNNPKKVQKGTCDWCSSSEVEVKPTRDFDEGTAGPIYSVCLPCRKNYISEQSKELSA